MKRFLCGLTFAFSLVSAQAGPGHDHDHEHEPAALAATPALPRFTASSPVLELVGVVEGTRLTLYLDRYADNAPVTDAQWALEVGGQALNVMPSPQGYFTAELSAPLQPGLTPVLATVTTGSLTDLLAADIDIHEQAHGLDGHSAWPRVVAYGLASLGGAVAALLGVWAHGVLRRGRAPVQSTGGAA
ncbi:hypothetical protein [Acidovorax lacteus]